MTIWRVGFLLVLFLVFWFFFLLRPLSWNPKNVKNLLEGVLSSSFPQQISAENQLFKLILPKSQLAQRFPKPQGGALPRVQRNDNTVLTTSANSQIFWGKAAYTSVLKMQEFHNTHCCWKAANSEAEQSCCLQAYSIKEYFSTKR